MHAKARLGKSESPNDESENRVSPLVGLKSESPVLSRSLFKDGIKHEHYTNDSLADIVEQNKVV